jgi:Gluconate 2-dehydrogenase subunit 3
MKEERSMTGHNRHRKSGRRMNRREMVRQLMLAGGAGLALPGIAEGHPVSSPPANLKTADQAGQQEAGCGWAPKFLDPHQNDTAIALAERIIPGSSRAQVNRFIDLLLSVDTPDLQKKFIAALSAFDAESLRRYTHPYKELTEDQQNEILTSVSATERGHHAEGQLQQVTMRDHFENIKKWIAGAYYSSEVGMKELGWTGQVYFTSFTGCRQP